MFGGIGMPELLVILVLVLVIFGAGKLAGVGRAVGESVRGFKDAVDTPQEVKIEDAEQK